MQGSAGKIFIFIGLIFVVIGLIIWFLPNRFNWIGHLPGDIRIERENFRLYMPFGTMILLSLIISLILRIWRYFQ
ncbi:MAG TPA: DUF2905 domain-containing protein [Daejeonella sp.]|nr:DUF2905 domain-containing protein [Daejeonella sp.]